MVNLTEKIDRISSTQRLLLALDEATAKLEAIEREKTEPIAIVGMGCRFPGGANNPDAYWEFLRRGGEGMSAIPSQRWGNESKRQNHPNSGGFIADVDRFDADFFGISPQEAISLDPQQRLLLEVTWEALENAGIAPQQLSNSQTGVFLGIGQNDYAQLGLNGGGSDRITVYDGTGNGFCFASGRLSYILGLKGTNLAVDTACSSSLVAVHLACQSLRAGECDLAIAAGVQLILSPEVSIFLAKTGLLSPDGCCRTFDDSANGFVRGEGCGAIILKRLSAAKASGDNILATIRGSATNQNGRSSSLIAPNGISQAAVIRQALVNSRLNPEQISYVEVQGTGSILGDAIEVRALGEVFADSRLWEQPLVIGSVKANIGHLEAASGMAGLIKVILQLQHQEIAPQINFQQPNSNINWQELPIIVPHKILPWNGQSRLAGVSAFGISGTNAHVILESAPSLTVRKEKIDRPCHLFTLSAKTETALQELVKKYREYFNNYPDLDVSDLCWTVNQSRAYFPCRLAIITSSLAELKTQLNSYLSEGKGTGFFSQNYDPNSTDWQTILENLAISYIRGDKIDWSIDDRNLSHNRIPLPTYPWQKQSYWLNLKDDRIDRDLPSQKTTPPINLSPQDIQNWLVDRLVRELGIPLEKIDINAAFDSYGLDSVMAIGLAAAGQDFIGIKLSPLLLVHYPNIATLTNYLIEELAKQEMEIIEI